MLYAIHVRTRPSNRQCLEFLQSRARYQCGAQKNELDSQMQVGWKEYSAGSLHDASEKCRTSILLSNDKVSCI